MPVNVHSVGGKMSTRESGDVSVMSACDSIQVSKVYAGCTPKKCQMKHVSADTAKQRIFNILARRRKSIDGSMMPLNSQTVENMTNKSHSKLGVKKAVNPKRDSSKSKPLNVSPRSKVWCHDGKLELSSDSSHVGLQTSSVPVCNTQLCMSSSSCLKTCETRSSSKRNSRRITISDNVVVLTPRFAREVSTPWSKIKTGLRSSARGAAPLADRSPAMRTDAGHTPLKLNHRRRRGSIYNERLI